MVLTHPKGPAADAGAATPAAATAITPPKSDANAIHYGLNAGSIWDDKMGRWMAYRDLTNHPNPVIQKRSLYQLRPTPEVQQILGKPTHTLMALGSQQLTSKVLKYF